MELALSILFGGVFIIFCVWTYLLRRKGQRLDERESRSDIVILGDNAESRVFELLKEMGCSPEYTEEETPRIVFKYQGQTFVIASKGRPFAMIWSYAWGSLTMPDSAMSLLEMSINYANVCGPYVTHYTINDESTSMEVHTTRMLHLPDGSYDLKSYLTSSLDGFFKIQSRIRDVFDDLKRRRTEQEQEADNSAGVWN